jgi:hypothetical protein
MTLKTINYPVMFFLHLENYPATTKNSFLMFFYPLLTTTYPAGIYLVSLNIEASL